MSWLKVEKVCHERELHAGLIYLIFFIYLVMTLDLAARRTGYVAVKT